VHTAAMFWHALALAAVCCVVESVCLDVTWSDIAILETRHVLVSPMWCEPFNDPSLGWAGRLPGGVMDSSGWAVVIDPCKPRSLDTDVTCKSGEQFDIATCISNRWNSVGEDHCADGVYVYDSNLIPITIENLQVRSGSTKAPVTIVPSKTTYEAYVGEPPFPACAPLWIAASGVEVFGVSVDLVNCERSPHLSYFDRICVWVAATKATNVTVHSVICKSTDVLLVVQPSPLTSLTQEDSIDIQGSLFKLVGRACGIGEIGIPCSMHHENPKAVLGAVIYNARGSATNVVRLDIPTGLPILFFGPLIADAIEPYHADNPIAPRHGNGSAIGMMPLAFGLQGTPQMDSASRTIGRIIATVVGAVIVTFVVIGAVYAVIAVKQRPSSAMIGSDDSDDSDDDGDADPADQPSDTSRNVADLLPVSMGNTGGQRPPLTQRHTKKGDDF
jgi:hypothetical protein